MNREERLITETKERFRGALHRIGASLRQTNGVLCTDIPGETPSGKYWRNDNRAEIEYIDWIEELLTVENSRCPLCGAAGTGPIVEPVTGYGTDADQVLSRFDAYRISRILMEAGYGVLDIRILPPEKHPLKSSGIQEPVLQLRIAPEP